MRIIGGLIFLLLSVLGAQAQGCGPQNPNCIVPTAPPGTNNNQAASTAFVQAAAVAPVPIDPNYVLAGPATGVTPGVPAGRALVGADLPVPSSSTLGGVESITCATHEWLNTISVAGVPACAQPATTDISGLGTIATQNANAVALTGGTITGLPTPSAASDAATKQYVDNSAVGLVVHAQVSLATAAALPANTYSNGSSGVGATLTGNSNGALTIDGVLTTSAIRVVVKTEAAAAHNGIYVVTTVGDGSNPYVLTRATDANTPGTGNPLEIGFGSYVFVTAGTANGNTGWSVNSTVTAIGTDAIVWAQFSSSAPVTVSNSDGSLTISPTSGNIVASLNSAHANVWANVQEISGTNLGLILNENGSAGSFIQYKTAGTTYWQLDSGPATSNAFRIFDLIAGRSDLTLSSNGGMALMQGGGYATIGNGFFADTSGHPYCDIRAFGGGNGVPSQDQTAFAAAFTNCSGGLVFIPCGNYTNTSTWTVGAGTTVRGAGRACVNITTTNAVADVFDCGGYTPWPTEFMSFAIYGVGATTGGSVPTAGYAFGCLSGGNQETFEDIEINGTYNGIAIGGTNGHIRQSRIEALYGTVAVYAPSGGVRIVDNQLDNNSEFNATGGAGFGTYLTYNTGAGVAITAGNIAASNGYLFIATVGGTTAPQSGGLPATTPMYKNITDGGVTWQLIGNTQLVTIIPGTQCWIVDNDLTTPANVAIELTGANGAVQNTIKGNFVAGEITAGIYLAGGVTGTHITDGQFAFIGYKQGTTPTGFPIYDAAGGDNSFTTIAHNTFSNGTDAAIIDQSNYWTINGNTITHNGLTQQYCGIALSGSGTRPAGTTVTGNIVFNAFPGVFCMAGGGSNTVVVGNSLFAGTSTFIGTSTSPGNL